MTAQLAKQLTVFERRFASWHTVTGFPSRNRGRGNSTTGGHLGLGQAGFASKSAPLTAGGAAPGIEQKACGVHDQERYRPLTWTYRLLMLA